MARTGVGDGDHYSGHSSDCGIGYTPGIHRRSWSRSHGFQDPGIFWDIEKVIPPEPPRRVRR